MRTLRKNPTPQHHITIYIQFKTQSFQIMEPICPQGWMIFCTYFTHLTCDFVLSKIARDYVQECYIYFGKEKFEKFCQYYCSILFQSLRTPDDYDDWHIIELPIAFKKLILRNSIRKAFDFYKDQTFKIPNEWLLDPTTADPELLTRY
jgi:hypothetical protein